MAVNVSKLSITQVDQIIALNNTGALEFILDEVQDTTLSQSEEKVDITGRGGRKISSLKKNKAVTGSGTNGFIVGGALASMVGSEVTEGVQQKVRITDIKIVDASNTVTVSQTPVGVLGNEIPFIYYKNADGSLGEVLTQGATAAAGVYEVSGTTVTFDTSVDEGTEVVVFYDAMVDAAKISNESDKYSKTLQLYIDCTAEDSCKNQYHVQFQIPRADFSGTFDLTFGGDPSTQAFEFEAMAGGCTGSNALWDMIVFE